MEDSSSSTVSSEDDQVDTNGEGDDNFEDGQKFELKIATCDESKRTKRYTRHNEGEDTSPRLEKRKKTTETPSTLPSMESLNVDPRIETMVHIEEPNATNGHPHRKSLIYPTSEPYVYSRWEKKEMKNYGSLNFQNTRSKVYQDFCVNELADKRPQNLAWKWFGFLMISLMMSITAFVLKYVTNLIYNYKKDYFMSLLIQERQLEAYLFFVGISLALIIISSALVVFVEPAATGPGIPEVIGYLNGVHIPGVFRLKVYVVKVVSVIASVSSGLPLGPEGPMIHIGGAIGAAVHSKHTPLRWIVPWYQFNPEEKSQFMLGGVASGVAAAFNAPIGGLTFAWEELSSYWENKQNWMILCTCMLSAFMTNLLVTLATVKPTTAYFNRDTIIFAIPPVDSLAAWIFIPAMIIGIIGGLLGVVFTWIALSLARCKRKYLHNNWIKLAEPCVIVILFMSIGFGFPYAFHCNPDEISTLVPHTINYTESGNKTIFLSYNSSSVDDLYQWLCPNGYQNPMSLLALEPGHIIIPQLLAFDNSGEFPMLVLFAFLVYYFLFSAWCAGGVSFASGFLVPMLCIGALYGRIFGEIVIMIVGESEWNHPGLYALMGAAAFFGGVYRLSISLTIIMIELSGNVLLAFPIMVSIMMAKSVADSLVHSLYHELLALKGVPYLDDVPVMSGVEMLKAKDIMTTNVVVLHPIERIRTVERILRSCEHSAFPVVSKDGHYEGLLRRKELLLLLSTREIFIDRPGDRPDKILTWKDMKLFRETEDQKAASVTVDITPQNLRRYINFWPYINSGVFAIPKHFFLKDAYSLFRTMALTHLVVVDEENHLVGIITRKDLLGDNINFTREKKEIQQIRKKTMSDYKSPPKQQPQQQQPQPQPQQPQPQPQPQQPQQQPQQRPPVSQPIQTKRKFTILEEGDDALSQNTPMMDSVLRTDSGLPEMVFSPDFGGESSQRKTDPEEIPYAEFPHNELGSALPRKKY